MVNDKLRKTYAFFKGLLIILLAIIFIFNNGYVGRTLSFIPLYLFGFGIFFFSLFLIFIGVLVILNRKIKKGMVRIIIATLIVALGFSLLFTTIINSSIYPSDLLTFANLNDRYNSLYQSYYTAYKTNFLFSNNCMIGGGIIGYALAASFNSLFNNVAGSIVIASVIIFASLIIFFFPLILKLFKKKNNSKKVEEETETGSNSDDESSNPLLIEEITTEDDKSKQKKKVKKEKVHVKDTTKLAIKKASELPDSKPTISVPVYKADPIPYPVNEEQEQGLSLPVFEDDKDTSIPLNKDKTLKMEDLEETISIVPSIHIESEPSQEEIPFEDDIEIKKEEEVVPDETIKESDISLNEDTKEKKDEILIEDTNEATSFNTNTDISIDFPSIQDREIEESEETELDEEFETPIEEEKESEVIQEPIKKKKERVNFIKPGLDLFRDVKNEDVYQKNVERSNRMSTIIDGTLSDFGISAHVADYIIGPSITRFNIDIASGVSVTKIENRVQDLNRSLGGKIGRFVSIIPGSIYSGYEVPNDFSTMVAFKDCYMQLEETNAKPLSVIIGKDVVGQVVYKQMSDFPHLLVAGTTKSGKSVFVKSLLTTLISRNSPDDLKLILVDPKKVEFGFFRNIPHLLTPIIDDPNKALVCLKKLKDEMNSRYTLLSKYDVTKIEDYNDLCNEENGLERLPFILFAIDEFADISQDCKDISPLCQSIAQKARACGIFLLISTQRPSSDVINGTLKSNLPTRICFNVPDNYSSVNVLNVGGAETLLGKGDGLLSMPGENGLLRFQSPFIDDSEVKAVCNYLRSNYETNYDDVFVDLEDHDAQTDTFYVPNPGEEGGNGKTDLRFDEIADYVMMNDYFSQAKLVATFGVGFPRAGKIIRQLQEAKILDIPHFANKGHKVLKHKNGYISGDQTSIPVSSELTSYDDDKDE